jgi:poly-gamma-glutamate capsule biosynthesis protein CapA/YwtB (metallophosphatase superfamily)
MSQPLLLALSLSLSMSTPATAQPNDTPLALLFAGDIMLDDGPGRTIAAGGDPLAPFDAILRAADYRIGNLECPVAAGGAVLQRKLITFRARPEVLPKLQGRFDAVSVANNHSGDYGQVAFVETLSHLQQAGINHVGGGSNLAEAHRPLWIERKGLKVALLAYNEFKPRSFEAGASWPGIAWSEDSHVVADIQAARKAGADIVIPYMHWGWEYEPKPDSRQQALAQKMIDAGASAVIGGHPHVTQGASLYRGKPIIWSLGNFVFDGFESAEPKKGWLARLRLDRKGVVSFDTLQASIDEAGTPHPTPDAQTPCWQRGQKQIGVCRNADLPKGQ